MPRLLRAFTLVAFAAVAACSDPDEIPDASINNVVDTVTLWTLSGGPLTQPTAYSVNSRAAVRTWEVGPNFEFAYDVDAAGDSHFLPLSLLGLANPNALRPGLQPSSLSFDGMTKAKLNGYITQDSLPVTEGDRFFVRTSVNTCAIYGVPLYGKLEILDIDSVAGTVTFRVLTNQNCAYRGLNLGIPKS